MIAAPLEAIPWPWRRWFYAVAFVFFAQVGLIFFVAERPGKAHRAPQFHTVINLAVDSSSQRHLAQLPILDDPTLFALPNLHGFSGAAWLTFAPVQHHFTDWSEPPRWLELENTALGKTFLGFVNTNLLAPLRIAEKPLPSFSSPMFSGTNELLARRSEIRFEGDLALRSLLEPLALPSWPHADVLTNTVVQLLVDANGDTECGTLLSSCGANEADQLALKLAAHTRFQSLRENGGPQALSGQITWGKMIFRWHTIPVVATNAISPPS